MIDLASVEAQVEAAAKARAACSSSGGLQVSGRRDCSTPPGPRMPRVVFACSSSALPRWGAGSGFGVVRDLLTWVLRDPAGRAALERGAAGLAAPALALGQTAAAISGS
jgi:hypothetical protein